jgi:hypothetical protein
MEQKDSECWEDFENEITFLEIARTNSIQRGSVEGTHFLFRGQGSQDWHLDTTLERKEKTSWSFSRYFQLILRARPQIETFTKFSWDIEDWPELDKWASNYDNVHAQFPAYDYLVFLRHHGFPTPLLDWTRSPYVAAFFAYNQPYSERVAIYVYQERVTAVKAQSSAASQILRFGPYVRSHSRHFLQQSEYTIGAKFQYGKWWYTPHEEIFATPSTTQDQLWKFTMPATERRRVLRLLDAYNLNEFSLFQSEESLLKTIAVRELDLREKDSQ